MALEMLHLIRMLSTTGVTALTSWGTCTLLYQCTVKKARVVSKLLQESRVAGARWGKNVSFSDAFLTETAQQRNPLEIHQPVTAWRDLSGHGNDLFADGGANAAPRLVRSERTGNYAVEFDGVDDMLSSEHGRVPLPVGGAEMYDGYSVFIALAPEGNEDDIGKWRWVYGQTNGDDIGTHVAADGARIGLKQGRGFRGGRNEVRRALEDALAQTGFGYCAGLLADSGEGA